ncbi:Retrovirus-related Pol polyprotein from transposon RE1 [Vitis vinifera]|uniref:Retrovirus-related Pol polyprotein from transposon RE1 n=1 Tax=Vitis vinifera TaxID=29760 RepID=A0A438IHA6_VITVI|nr:Retrovirus-related Pol polyprotein from transposon RE1 [Vitis vinifera]
MNEEMKSLQKNETWELVECPPGKKPVGCRWIYTVKYKADASIERFKARLVAKGYTQTYGIDYTETFAPVAKINTIRGRYQRLVGRLMYLAHTRPDLTYALSVVSQYMHNPGEQHMNAVMRILRYLKNAPGKGILFAKNVDHQSIEVYTDADWVGAVDDRRSTSGYFTFVGGNIVTWKSKKQNVVARSSAEAKFRGMALGLCEALWLRLLLQDLGYLSRQPIRLFCDNKAACDIAHNPVQQDRTKHVEVDRFFIKEKLDDKIVELPKIRSEDQLTDILTKAVSSQVFSKFLNKLGMCDIYAPT